MQYCLSQWYYQKEHFLRIILIYNKYIFTWHKTTYHQCQRHYLQVIHATWSIYSIYTLCWFVHCCTYIHKISQTCLKNMIQSLCELGKHSESTKNIIFELIPTFHGVIEHYWFNTHLKKFNIMIVFLLKLGWCDIFTLPNMSIV
jgi:hypothetical protein